MLAERLDFTAAFGETRQSRSRGVLYLALAVLPHLALAWSASHAEPKMRSPESAPFLVELEAALPVPAPSPPEPLAAPPPPLPFEASRVPQRVERPMVDAAPSAVAAAEPSEPSDAPATEEEPAVEEAAPLLTDPMADAAWSLPSGNGSALGGSLAKGGGPSGTRRAAYLAPRDFSRDPVPPNLMPLVRRNYPSAAKMYGYEGTVRVSLLVHSDGSVSDVKVEDADPSGRGFGEACTRTMLQGGAWKPRLDRNGRPVDSPSEFTCPFRL